MPDLNVIKYNPDGDPESGLDVWEAMSADIVVSGDPVQRGFQYFSTEGDKFISGVWDCTATELKPGPYDVDEFMIVLEGSISLRDKDGQLDTFRAGESFIIPKGTECAWVQSEYARKYYVIYDNPNSAAVSSDALKPIRVDSSITLPRMPEQDPALFIGDAPDMGILVLYSDPDGKYDVGIWDCNAMHRIPSTLARSELMHILEGRGSITNADGVVFEFEAGDTFLVPVGMGYQWRSDEYVKKLFCSYTP